MARTIDFCIPFVAPGIAYLEYLIDNIEKTAHNANRIRIHVSYHTEVDLAVLNKSRIRSHIYNVVHARAYSEQDMLFAVSANHSSAVNALTLVCTGEIVICSDYDMAFPCCHWDALIESLLFDRELLICGVTYPRTPINLRTPVLIKHMPWLEHTTVAKYQNLPNLCFFCIRGDILREVFHNRLTKFDDFLIAGGLPLRIINTLAQASANNIPLGMMQWLDTGYEIPEIIHEKKLPYGIFPYVSLTAQEVFQNLPELETNVLRHPEVFVSPIDQTPFLCHFKKGTIKSTSNDAGNFTFDFFKNSIDTFLSKNLLPTQTI